MKMSYFMNEIISGFTENGIKWQKGSLAGHGKLFQQKETELNQSIFE